MDKNKKENKEDNLLKEARLQRPFGRLNYICMGICVVLIIVGFALMSGPGSTVETGFNPDIFSTRRIVVGPTIAFLGFLLMAFAIIIRPGSFDALKERLGKKKHQETPDEKVS